MATFEKCMMGSSAQDHVLRLQDTEIKLLEMVRDCIQARVQSDKEYARLLSQSCVKAHKHEHLIKTPFSQVWMTLIEKTTALSTVIKNQAELMVSSTIDKLQVLIADKRAAKQMFQEEKSYFELELNKAKAEVNRHYGEYTKAMVKVKAKRSEHDDLLIRGRSGKLDDIKKKYSLLTEKLHKIHNEYVLSMKDGGELQKGMYERMMPMYLSAQQDYCQNSIAQCKSILLEYVEISKSCNVESSSLHASMKEVVTAIDPDQEYASFIDSYQSEHKVDKLAFDSKLFEGYTGNLRADELAVDDSTFDALEQLRAAYSTKLSSLEPNVKAYQQQVQVVKDEISNLSPKATKAELVPKKRHLKWLERKLEEQTLCKSRQQAITELIASKLSQANSSNLPRASDLDSQAENGAIAPLPTTNRSNSDPPDTGIKKLTRIFGKGRNSGDGTDAPAPTPRVSKPTPVRDDYYVVIPGEGKPVKMTDDPGTPLEDEEWFHGILPREEVQRLLKQDGDYLVRESKKKNTAESQYVLSVMWQGPKHFIIQTGESGWRLEGQAHPTIQQLIIHQHKSNTAVTNRSQAILKTPVMRETWQIRNDDIKLEDKIGNGNFGEVFRGKYQGAVVAIKTCKEELQEDQKKKFILEGRILRRYDHPNIVKFVGIAAQRNPVMIVMEYVSGGALLSWLRKNGLSENKKNLIQMCLDAAKGMAYLESKNVLHRDLAARNCLISEKKVVKISDFGMSREEETYEVTQGMRQIPIKWTAPEALNYGKYTSLCDVWSFGILMWEVFSGGKTPYSGMKNQESRDRVDNGYRMPSPEGCPVAVYSLMRDCWEERPERRPRFNMVVKELEDALIGR